MPTAMGALSADAKRVWGSSPNIRDVKEGERVPLSFNQEQELSIGHLPPDHPLHLVSRALKIDGPLDINTLEKCVQTTINNHEALRTSFTGVHGQKPIQLVQPQMDLSITITNLHKSQRDDHNLIQTLSEEAQRPIDIANGPLLRINIFKLNENSTALLLTTHRAICDESSMAPLLRIIFEQYEAEIYGQKKSSVNPSMQYSEFAGWQRKQFPAEKLKSKFEDWKRYVDNGSITVQLPIDFPLPPTPSYKGARHYLSFDNTIKNQLENLAKSNNVSISNVILSTFAILLQRYSGQVDFGINTRMSSHLLPGLKQLVGCYSNTVILRANLTDNPNFVDLIKRLKNSVKLCEEFADIPVEKILREGNQQECNVMFTFEDDYVLAPLNGIRFTRIDLDVTASKYELSLNLTNSNDGLFGFIEYNPDLFTSETIKRIVGHMQTFVTEILKKPNERISKYRLLTKEELIQLRNWNNNVGSFDIDQLVHRMIEEQVAKTPNELAIIHDRCEMSYANFNAKCNQIAFYLQDLGIGPEMLVAICMERCIDNVAAILGVLKAGGGFVFIDPNYPKDRISYMLENTQSRVVISQTSVKSCLPIEKDVQIVLLDDDSLYKHKKKENPNVDVNPTNLSYVQYTSGSTGRPKGVMVEHRHFVTQLLAGADIYKRDVIKYQLAATTLSYVPGILELFFPLVLGQVVVVSKNAFEVPMIPSVDKVNYIGAVPSVMTELVRTKSIPNSVYSVAMFGETVTKQLVREIFEQTKVQEILIHYGCTECGTVVIFPVEKDYRRNPPIGRPLENSQFHILDPELQPVPIGVPGELYLVTSGLSRGYMQRPDLTSERFIDNPYKDGLALSLPDDFPKDLEWTCDKKSNEWLRKMYKTGDLVRYRPDGTVDIIGRIDYQVKIRGIRVELGEIENGIARHPVVKEVVVTAFQPVVGDKKLVAYVVFHNGKSVTTQEMRKFLTAILPGHMIPSVFMVLDKMPQTANGKVDRKLLPAPETNVQIATTNIAARNEIEKKMQNLWQTILQVQNIGIEDNFYEVGGNSLRAIQLMLKVSDEFKINLPAKSLFEHPTIAGLCPLVQSALEGGVTTSEAFDPEVEAVLDEDIYPARAYMNVETLWNPKDLFITGTTGFLGAFLLSDLLKQTKAHAHCLVRAKNVKEGLTRIETNMTKYGLWDPSFALRVHPVLGDLEKPLLGLTRTAFFQLGQRCDVIYHCGAPVNFVKPYSILKSGAVLGTQEILRLACLFKVKPVHYVSSVVVLASVTKKVIYEMDNLNNANSFFHMGYTRAKWVGEMLVWIAKSRGLPVTILRPGYVVGHSRTGATNTNDYFSRLVKGCIQVGCYPDMDDMMWLIPVDYVSRAIVHVTRLWQSLGKAFHLAPLVGADVTTVQMLGYLKDYGYQIKRVDSGRWVDALEEQVRVGENELLPLLPYIALKYRDDYKEQSKRTADYDSSNTLMALEGSVIRCPKVDQNLINVLFNYYISIGYIQKPNKGSE